MSGPSSRTPPGSAPGIIGNHDPYSTLVVDSAGIYLVSLVEWDGAAYSEPDEITVTVTMNLPPVSIIDAPVLSGIVPLTVNFAGSNSYDPEGGQLLYRWETGDGGTYFTPQVVHRYTFPAIFTVTLYVEDDRGQRDTTSVQVDVQLPTNTPPIVSANATPSNAPAPLEVAFTARATDPDGDPLGYLWDFGDLCA